MEDAQIVELYWQRDPEAIRETDCKYGCYCRTVAWNILTDIQDVEECVNDTWMGAWNAMPVQRPVYLAAFLGRITRNLAFNRFKSSRAEKRGGGELPLALEELEGCVPTSPSAAQEVEDAELERMVNCFLHTLSSRDCDVFLRRYWFVESMAEIAARYGMKENSVKTSLFRSRKKLKAYLEREGVLL